MPFSAVCHDMSAGWCLSDRLRLTFYLHIVLHCRTTNLVIRGAMLFSVGVFLALVLNLLQVQRNVTLFPPDVISSIFSSAWWVPPCCGTASGRGPAVILECVAVSRHWVCVGGLI